MAEFEPVKLVIFIVNRGDGKKVEQLCSIEGLYGHLILHGRGTVDNGTLSLLGLDERERDVVLLTVARSRMDEIMEKITARLRLNEPGRGIALSIPMSAIASQLNSYYAVSGLAGANAQTAEAKEQAKDEKGAAGLQGEGK